MYGVRCNKILKNQVLILCDPVRVFIFGLGVPLGAPEPPRNIQPRQSMSSDFFLSRFLMTSKMMMMGNVACDAKAIAEEGTSTMGAPVTLLLMIEDEQEEAGGGAKNVAEECNNNSLPRCHL